MSNRERNFLIQYLLRHWIAGQQAGMNVAPGLEARRARKSGRPRQEEIRAYEAKLISMSNEALAALAKEANARADDPDHDRPDFFSTSDKFADFDHWSRAAYWTPEEAVALSLSRDPKRLNRAMLKRFAGKLPFVRQYEDLLDLVNRAIAVRRLKRPMRPPDYIAWAEAEAVPLPLALVELVSQRPQAPADWASRYAKLKEFSDESLTALRSRVQHLTQEREALERQLDELRNEMEAARADLTEREKDSLLKMVIGMAMGGYGYAPGAGRNAAIPEIVSDIELQGLTLHQDTVRKWLRIASESVRPREMDI